MGETKPPEFHLATLTAVLGLSPASRLPTQMCTLVRAIRLMAVWNSGFLRNATTCRTPLTGTIAFCFLSRTRTGCAATWSLGRIAQRQVLAVAPSIQTVVSATRHAGNHGACLAACPVLHRPCQSG